MNHDRMTQSLTSGFLPVDAFRHLDPTAMGFVDLDGPLKLSYAGDASRAQPHRDGLVLVRLHADPVAILHVSHGLDDLSATDLAAEIWQQAGPAIRRHIAECGCVSPPGGPGSLLPGLQTADGDCPPTSVGPTEPSVTVIIPTAGRPRQLERCLRSMRSLRGPEFDILVVDNRPDKGGTKQVVGGFAASDLRVRYLAEHRPGSSVARNRGIAATAAEFVALTDDDVVVDENWLIWLLAPFGDRDVMAVTGMVLPLELQTAAQKRFEQYAGFSKGLDRRAYDLKTARADNRMLYPYWGGVFGSGNSMAFRRSDIAAAGGFDPTLGAGSPALAGADMEAMSAAILRGGRLVYEPRSLCWHEHRRDDDALRRQIFNYGAGFTAILTKYLISDARFLAAAMRSIPVALKLRRRRTPLEGDTSVLPKDFARLARRGMLKGPRLYAKSRRWSRRLDLDQVIRGN